MGPGSAGDGPAVRDISNVARPVVRLRPGKSKLFYAGNAIVLENAVDGVVGTGSPAVGDIVPLVDHNNCLIGWGAYNPHSLFRLRILHNFVRDGQFDIGDSFNLEKLVADRIQKAADIRKRVGLPSAETNVYRLINGEGDRLSGLVVDVFADRIVMESSAAWVELNRPLIIDSIKAVLGDHYTFIWKRSEDKLRQEGYKGMFEHEEIEDGVVVVREHGLSFEVDLKTGQKTGFYCDHRENRNLMASYANGAEVLDCFTYTGGFGLHAAARGAKSVTMIDSSPGAIESAVRNAKLNGLNADIKKGDVFDFLHNAQAEGRKWDIVIIDPPKFAPKVKNLPQATRKYRGLNKRALSVVKDGGLLLTCTCSRAMSASGTFIDVLEQAAREANKNITVLNVLGAGPDHPNHPMMPETIYLTAVLLAVNS